MQIRQEDSLSFVKENSSSATHRFTTKVAAEDRASGSNTTKLEQDWFDVNCKGPPKRAALLIQWITGILRWVVG
jgi:hypothetical protein